MARSTLAGRLADLALLAILAGLAAILTAAMALQYAGGEIPCPLCLLQRVAMFGICFGIIRHVRDGYDGRNIGIGLVWALFLLLVSVRQVLLNIVARPGHAYPGSAVLGLHMPVWSVVIAFAVLSAFAAMLALFDGERLRAAPPSPSLRRIGAVALAASDRCRRRSVRHRALRGQSGLRRAPVRPRRLPYDRLRAFLKRCRQLLVASPDPRFRRARPV